MTAETYTISVGLTGPQLSLGLHSAILTVSDTGGLSPPATVTVNVTALGLPGDLDFDGDVDQSDFGRLQLCLTNAGIPVIPSCANADLDGDLSVTQSDYSLFQRCLAGET